MHIITGLPRSGSTLLANILNQNPRFHASETSALPGLLTGIRMSWESVRENNTKPKLETKKRVLRAVAEAYYDQGDKVIFDKNRAWLREVELAQWLWGEEVRFLVTVRDLVDVLASFEKLHRSQAAFFDSPDRKNLPEQTATVAARTELLASSKGAVGILLASLKEFLTIYTPSYYLIEYDDLTRYPQTVMKEIYQFLDEKYFEHNFNKVKQTTSEDDSKHGILGLHDIKEKVKRNPSQAVKILGGDLFQKYSHNEFWRQT